MIAFLIAAIGFLAVARLQTVTTDSAVVTAQGNEALQYAEDKLNTFRTTSSYTAGTYGSTASTGYANLVSGSDTVTGVNASYTRTWTVQNLSFNASNAVVPATDTKTCTVEGGCFKYITMVVTWTDITGVLRSLTLNTHVSSVDPAASGGLSN